VEFAVLGKKLLEAADRTYWNVQSKLRVFVDVHGQALSV
jgi:hypothetical protein